MGSDLYLSFLPAVIGLSFVGLIVLAIAAIQDSRHGAQPSDIVKRVYVYLVSFITLLMVAVSVASLLDLGLRASVLPKADPVAGYSQEPPTSLYFNTTTAEKPVREASAALTCDAGCSLTEADRSDIASWKENFEDWKSRHDIASQRARALVTPISFLVIAGLVFVFHWMLVRKDQKTSTGANLTRSTYFTAMSFIWLISFVVAGGMFLNTILTSVIPGADSQSSRAYPMVSTTDRDAVEKLVNCGTTCNLDAATVSTAQTWLSEFDAWKSDVGDDSAARSRQNSLAMEIAFLVISIPLFLLHFKTAWKEKRQDTPHIA